MLTIKNYEYLTIHKLVEYDHELDMWDTRGRDRPLVTHALYLYGPSMLKSKNIEDPNVGGVCIYVRLRSAMGIGRPSNSCVIVHKNNLYYAITWTDILGPGHGRQNAPRRYSEGRAVYPLRIAGDRERSLVKRKLISIANDSRPLM